MAQSANIVGPPLAARIREARREAGMTMRQLAAKLDVHERTVANYEEPRTTPTLERLVQIADVTGKPLSFFLNQEAA